MPFPSSLRQSGRIALFTTLCLLSQGLPGGEGSAMAQEDRQPPNRGRRVGQIVPPALKEVLKLSDEQSEKIASLQAEVDAKLKAIFTEEQQQAFANFMPNAGRGPGQEGREGPGGEMRGQGPGQGQGSFSAELMAQLMAQDKNQDGKLSKDELPTRMQPILERADKDHDGFATQEELTQLTQEPNGQGPGGMRGEGRRGGGGGREMGRGAVPLLLNPTALVERLFELDADKDGKLTREELEKAGEVLRRPMEGRGPGRPEEGPPR